MAERCRQELCIYWSGDGRVCTCAQLDIEPESLDEPLGEEETP